MDEFSLINTFFKSISHHRPDVIFGIGDDAACLDVPPGMNLLVSCDTLVEDVHFKSHWGAYNIACRAVMVNVSDIAAMGGTPCWATLALTLPTYDEVWLKCFSDGLHDSFARFNIALIGGDTTRGPLSITLTIHGLVEKGHVIKRSGASVGDKIYVSGELGAAALGVDVLTGPPIPEADHTLLMKKLFHPHPRVDLQPYLQAFATAAIDISDGLSSDLNHLCSASGVGACLNTDTVPIHPLVKHYKRGAALDFALHGGDDYELCFTLAAKDEPQLKTLLRTAGLICYPIGVIEKKLGLRLKTFEGQIDSLDPAGYKHF